MLSASAGLAENSVEESRLTFSMPSVSALSQLCDRTTAHYCDQDELDSALTKGGLALEVFSNAANPLNVDIGFKHTDCARILTGLGSPSAGGAWLESRPFGYATIARAHHISVRYLHLLSASAV